jgi:membrane protein implicated in regulation of membrane protease activity
MRLLRSIALRYFLLQLPGWILLSICAFALWVWQLIPGWLALAIVAVWLIKDIALYPVVRSAFAPSEPAAGRLVGQSAVAIEAIAPTGYVRLAGELWRAELEDPTARVQPGERVTVRSARGLTLIVSADAPDAGGRSR